MEHVTRTIKKQKNASYFVFCVSCFMFLFFVFVSSASAYTLLQPLPGKQEVQSFPEYLNLIIPFILGFAAVAAVVMLTYNGILYAISEAIDSKKSAIEGIQSALLGLLIALMSWIILYTINPDLTVLRLQILDITLQSAQNTNAPAQSPIPFPNQQNVNNANCVPAAGTLACDACPSPTPQGYTCNQNGSTGKCICSVSSSQPTGAPAPKGQISCGPVGAQIICQNGCPSPAPQGYTCTLRKDLNNACSCIRTTQPTPTPQTTQTQQPTQQQPTQQQCFVQGNPKPLCTGAPNNCNAEFWQSRTPLPVTCKPTS